MKYDFESYLTRRETGSSKWLNMDSRCSNIGEGVIPMSVADMDFLTAPEIVEGITEYAKTQTLGYSKPVDSYLESVIKFFKDYHNYEAKKEWIVTTPGIVSALATSVRAFTEVGDEVIIFTPVYHPFYDVIEGQGRKILECPLIYDNNEYKIDFDKFNELASKSEVKLVLFCSPHNPGGVVWTKEDLLKVVEIVEKNDLLIVSDEIHSDLIFNNKEHIILGRVNDTIGDRAIVCTAASKTFNIAGLQCSNIFIKNENIRKEFVKCNENIGIERANVLGLVATKSAYDNALDWLEEVKQVIDKNNKIVIEFFEEYGDNFKVMKPDASFLVWVNFENLEKEHGKFMSFLDTQCNFFTSDGLSFGDNGENFIRINTGLPTKKLLENLDRVKKYLKEYYNLDK
ncbi:MalY/PatB family protein [Miniphocaeibacter halophilus]|uniref:PatB family C-S lyase n=1 Tax=Miniphocaeibacter halophilus TaxID=2931922 RepID=A0AC61MQK2_9FIRM|nr:PatB family C-S lyase [Miniphocaeibacter halophilus]QQK07214.1 PatB family C-S lyase [Miniphocaeibacter halophilus]